VVEYSGLDPKTPFDATASNSGTGTSVTSGPVTTRFAPELLFAAASTYGSFDKPGAMFSLRLITQDENLAEDRTVTTAGTYSADAPLPRGSDWLFQVATFH
jgi:hypothetical protein